MGPILALSETRIFSFFVILRFLSQENLTKNRLRTLMENLTPEIRRRIIHASDLFCIFNVFSINFLKQESQIFY